MTSSGPGTGAFGFGEDAAPGFQSDAASAADEIPGFPSDDGPADYVRPDELILDDVVKVLAWDRQVLATGLSVTCKDRVVTIGGDISSPDTREHIEMLVGMHVLGVTELVFDLPRPKQPQAAKGKKAASAKPPPMSGRVILYGGQPASADDDSGGAK